MATDTVVSAVLREVENRIDRYHNLNTDIHTRRPFRMPPKGTDQGLEPTSSSCTAITGAGGLFFVGWGASLTLTGRAKAAIVAACLASAAWMARKLFSVVVLQGGEELCDAIAVLRCCRM
jgi:hypothetical protein